MLSRTEIERDPGRGRPPSTTHDEVGRVALELFARDGFDETTMEDIAAELGVGRRTVFRYFPSKNDMVWGDFSWVCERLRAELVASDPAEPLIDSLARAVIASNHYEESELPELRIRMGLITSVPALQAHSMLRYAEWRAVVAEFTAERLGMKPDDLIPQTVAHTALATSMAAFTCWVRDGGDLDADLERAWSAVTNGFRFEDLAP